MQSILTAAARFLRGECTRPEIHCWEDAFGIAGDKYELCDGVLSQLCSWIPSQLTKVDEDTFRRQSAEQASARGASEVQAQATTVAAAAQQSRRPKCNMWPPDEVESEDEVESQWSCLPPRVVEYNLLFRCVVLCTAQRVDVDSLLGEAKDTNSSFIHPRSQNLAHA